MSRWTLVPIRSLATGKSRLAGVLDDAERVLLNHTMLARVLDAVAQVDGQLSRCIVASAGDDALNLARSRGAIALRDASGGFNGLNAALEGARTKALSLGATSVLTLAADLPEVSAAALRRMLTAHRVGSPVVIADKHGSGTNGLLLPARCGMRFAFGDGSLERHVSGLRDEGFDPVVWRDSVLGFDLDTVDDYQRWREQVSARVKVVA